MGDSTRGDVPQESSLLLIMVGLLVGRAISMLQKAPTLGFAPPPETDWGTLALNELEEEEMLVPSYPQMQEVS
jgi:ABC-type dipeptide/oligopeptide/nickel transport system permease subunit